MKLLTLFSTGVSLLAVPATSQEMTADVDKGESEFARQCVSCHVIENEDGEVLAGRAGRIGPNLYGVIGKQPGKVEDFRYSDAIIAYGELVPEDDQTETAPSKEDLQNVVWGQDNTTAFLQDPNGFLREALESPRARSKMTYKVRDEQAAVDITAYLATFSPDFEHSAGAESLKNSPGEKNSAGDAGAEDNSTIKPEN